jgi:hypothetical protein
MRNGRTPKKILDAIHDVRAPTGKAMGAGLAMACSALFFVAEPYRVK